LSLLDTILDSFRAMPVPQPRDSKAAYDVLPMGVQGRPQYPNVDIPNLQNAYRKSEIVYAPVRAAACRPG
jgi:hypothetical protein